MDRWFTAAEVLKMDPWELCRRWTDRQLDRFLAWTARQLNVPGRTDHYLMALGERLAPEMGDMTPLKFGSGLPQRKLTKKQQAEKDRRESQMWVAMIQAQSDKRKKPRG